MTWKESNPDLEGVEARRRSHPRTPEVSFVFWAMAAHKRMKSSFVSPKTNVLPISSFFLTGEEAIFCSRDLRNAKPRPTRSAERDRRLHKHVKEATTSASWGRLQQCAQDGTLVTENIISKQTFMVARTMPRPFNNSGSKFLSSVVQRPSAHLTLRDTSSQGYPQPGLHQSCRHVVRSWANRSLGAHLHNMTLSNGKLRVPQDGRYYLYSQVYFRYPSPASGDADQRSVSHQLVQCVYKKTSYPSPIQLLKGVGTKCWAPDAEYALHSVYQGGLFELRAGDELFVSVSSPTMLNADDSSSYFGAFRLDL
ncbi:tumor necrosis factor ligand superfamily member 10-like isoform X2 [Phycodurus eques]|uniref:tumor necrosis factor ligand superfamily member 10-like isoform X2 n=1 Tax=Phycodurus eques TaxID=693459 RepID=UPI002ACE4A72|nr:tumor necrosis factor ligand superfamily member 10-like isoform X2 [Phycodurus eques]